MLRLISIAPVIGAVIRPLSLIPSLRYTTNLSLGYWLDDRPSHPFRISVIWNNVVVVGELFVADRASATLFSNLPVQQLSDLGRDRSSRYPRGWRGSSILWTQVGPALAWEGVRVHSKKAIGELGTLHWHGVSSDVSW